MLAENALPKDWSNIKNALEKYPALNSLNFKEKDLEIKSGSSEEFTLWDILARKDEAYWAELLRVLNSLVDVAKVYLGSKKIKSKLKDSPFSAKWEFEVLKFFHDRNVKIQPEEKTTGLANVDYKIIVNGEEALVECYAKRLDIDGTGFAPVDRKIGEFFAEKLSENKVPSDLGIPYIFALDGTYSGITGLNVQFLFHKNKNLQKLSGVLIKDNSGLSFFPNEHAENKLTNEQLKAIYMKEKTKLPGGWKKVKLSNEKIFEIIMGQSPPSSSYNEKNVGMPFLQGNAEFGKFHPTPRKYTQIAPKIANKNDILMSVRAPVGEINICDKELCIGRGLCIVRIMKGNYYFYYYYLQFQKNKIKALAQGSTFEAITKNEVNKIFLMEPPLNEQKAIAKILSTVDEAIEKTDRLIEKVERVKKGCKKTLLRDNKKHEKQKVENKFTLEYGKSLIERNRIEGHYPVYGSNGVVGYHNNYYIKGPGIVVGRKGSIGEISWSYENFWPIDTTYYVNLKDNYVHLGWLYYKLGSLNLKRLNMATGTPGLNRELVHFMDMYFPPMQEQKRIAEILSTIDQKLEHEKTKKQKFERLKKGLMQKLLTGEKRVDVNKVLEV